MSKRAVIVGAIHRLLKENPEQEFITHNQIVEEAKLSFDTVDRHLKVMKEENTVRGTRSFEGWYVALTDRAVIILEDASPQLVVPELGFRLGGDHTEG